MAKVAGKDSAVYLGGYDLSGSFNKSEPAMARDLADVTCFGDSGHKYIPTIQNDALSISGFFEAGSGKVDEIMESLIASLTTLWHCIDGVAAGKIAYCAEGRIETYKLSTPVDGAIILNSDFKADGKFWRCLILEAKAQKTTDGDGSGLDGGAESSDGAVAFLQVFECGADDNLVITIEDDDNANFDTPNTLITFTAANGITQEIKKVTGTVQQYVRATWNGVEPWQATFAVAFCRL